MLAMEKFEDIIERIKNSLAAYMLLIGALFLAVLLPINLTNHEIFSPGLLTLLFSSLIMALSAALVFFAKNNKNSIRNVAMILMSPMVWISLSVANHPDVAGAYVYMPVVVVATTFVTGTKIGFLVCLSNMIFIHLLANQILVKFDAVWHYFDSILYIDRTMALLMAFVIGALFNKTLEKAILAIRDQSEKAEKRQRMVSLGAMVGGIAHEINSPIQIVQWAIGQVAKKIEDENDLRWISKSQKAIDRIQDITHSLLYFTESGARQLAEGHGTNMMESWEEVYDAVHRRLKTCDIVLDIRIDEKILIIGKRFHLSTILRALVDNSIDALAESNTLSKSIWVWQEIDKANIHIYVEDNGPGVSALIEERIFEPFFSTKELGPGIGLSTSYAICQALGWDISYSRQMAKTSFVIRIPNNAHQHLKHSA